MSTLLALLTGLIFAAGIYLILCGNFLRLIFGLGLASNAVNLVIFTAGGLSARRPPLIAAGQTVPTEPVANALPQAMILTAIVIGFAIITFVLALFYRHQRTEAAAAEEGRR
ncbi:MAG: NADH-quinone oxidoreductase subunit K [Desulfosarcinaceae bacterium]|nr:NADH-quinone oxidoreductase subunit K [Desulfosarcinaceae bacterium]